jgi:putative ABC transport system permease protein
MSLVRLALAGVLRRPVLSLAVGGTLALLSASLLISSALSASVGHALDQAAARLGADAMVLPASGPGLPGGVVLFGGLPGMLLPEGTLEVVERTPGVAAAAPRLFIASSSLPCCAVANTLLVGYEPERDFAVGSWLRDRLDRAPAPDEIVAGSSILNEVGGRLAFYGTLFRIVAKLEPTGVRRMDSAIFIPMEGARRMLDNGEAAPDVPAGRHSAILLRFAPSADADAVSLRMEAALPGVVVAMADRALADARKGMAAPLIALRWAGALGWALVLMLVSVVMALSLENRRAELGLMRALGARQGHLVRLLGLEAFMLCASGSVAGALMGAGALRIFQASISAALGLPDALPGLSETLALGSMAAFAATLAGLVASAYPALRATRVEPFALMAGRRAGAQ